MIKINLLGVAGPPTKVVEGPPATRAFQIATFVGALVVCFAIVGVFYKIWSTAVADLKQKLKQEQTRQAELAGVQAQNQRYEQRLRELETRINTIQALQNSRVGPVELMIALGNVVNRANDLYLFSVAPQGDRVAIRGQSNSVESMATFLASLSDSGYFADVQLRQFFEDDQVNRLSYKFTLDCVYKSPAAAAQPAAPAGAAPPARRAGL